MVFVFDFCVAAFGADDRLSIALLNSENGETLIVACAASAAIWLVEELGSALKLRDFNEDEEPWYS